MKQKVAFLFCILPIIIFIISILILPKEIPLHFTINGKIDMWGSKYINIIFCIFPCILYFMSKKSAKNNSDDYLMLMFIMFFFDVLFCVITVNAYMICNEIIENGINIIKVTFGIFSFFLVVLGLIGQLVSSLRQNVDFKLYLLIGGILCGLTFLVKSSIVYILLVLSVCLGGKLMVWIYKKKQDMQ